MNRVAIATLMSLGSLAQSALTVYLPSAPAIATAFGETDTRVQLLLTAFMIAHTVVLPFVGPLSDRIGRKPVIVTGLSLFVLASLAGAFAQSFDQLLVARAVQGIGSCAMMVLPRAVVRDTTTGPAAARFMAFLSVTQSLANIVGPVAGGLLYEWMGWQGSFYFEALGAAIALAFSLRLPETARRSGNAGRMIQSYRLLLGNRIVICNILSIAGSSAGFYAFIVAGPAVYMTTLGLTATEFAFAPLLWGGSFSVSALCITPIIGRVSEHAMIMAGNLTCIAGAAIMSAFALLGLWDPFALMAPAALLGIGQALHLPRATNVALQAAPVEIAGAASALHGVSQYAIGAIASALMAVFSHATPIPLALVVLAWCILGFIAYLPAAPIWTGRKDKTGF